MGDDERADSELLALVAAGDESALRVLFDRHACWLSLRLRRRCGDGEIVDDALQDAFVAVWQQASRYRGEGDVGAWLWGIAIRRLISRLRRSAAPSALGADVIDAAVPTVVSAEEQLLLAVEHGDAGSALRSLSPELRRVIQATVIDGLTTREASRLLGIPEGTVKSRMRLARTRLREQLIPLEEGRP